MKQSKKCIILAIVLVLIAIVSIILPTSLVMSAMLYGINTANIFRVVIAIISIFLCFNALMYSKEYKKKVGKRPNGYGIMILGSIMNIIGFTIGVIFIGVGVVFALFNTKKL